MQALLVYYSFTDQARIAVDIVSETLRQRGVKSETLRIDYKDPSQRPTRPLPFSEQVKLGDMAQRRQTVPIVLDAPERLQSRYDLIVLFSNTWKFHPSVPVQSFLASPEASALLRDTPFAVVVVCRGFWRRNLRLVREQAEAHGGRFVGGEGFGFAGGWLSSTIQSIRYVARKGVAERRWGLIRLPPFGLSPYAKTALRAFADRLPLASAGETK